MATKKNKAELQAEQVAALVGAGKAVALETVDFSDPNRPKTCLEVDFPILPINQVAMLEGNAGKPIYQMSKWWARRRSSVFRSLLIAAATKAPEDEQQASKMVWDAYYANHQRRSSFKDIKVADIFMGGGTTLVEGSRLGMQMVGNDLNPVAWLVVKNELSSVKRESVEGLLRAIEDEVKPQIMPFYATTCPRGHKSKWIEKSSGRVMGAEFSPLLLDETERAKYRHEGPEVIYTFWAKHGPCHAPDCGHRTPLLSTHVITVKTLTVKSWASYGCDCGHSFDIEQQPARMAPAAPLVVSSSESSFAVMDDAGGFACPSCGKQYLDHKARVDGESMSLGKAKNKKVDLTLLVHPSWMHGEPDDGVEKFGGSVTDDASSTEAWIKARARSLRFIEVRGALPDEITAPDTGVVFKPQEGNIPKQARFACQEATCGREQAIVESVAASQKSAPASPFVQHCKCPQCDAEGRPYGGRYFVEPDVDVVCASFHEWERRRDADLAGLWPKSEIPFGHMTHQRQPLPQHGYLFWKDMFNSRQLLIHAQLLKAITTLGDFPWEVRESVLGGFQQYLRNQNMFCFWNPQRDTPEPHFSNNNYHPKTTVIENSVFPDLGRGNWASCVEGLVEGIDWCEDPWEMVSHAEIASKNPQFAKELGGKSERARLSDPVLPNANIYCGSSTDLTSIAAGSHDLVITDPPFGGLLHYAELADFFMSGYVWH